MCKSPTDRTAGALRSSGTNFGKQLCPPIKRAAQELDRIFRHLFVFVRKLTLNHMSAAADPFLEILRCRQNVHYQSPLFAYRNNRRRRCRTIQMESGPAARRRSRRREPVALGILESATRCQPRPTLPMAAPKASMAAASVPRSSPCRPFFSFFCRSCFSIKVAPGDILNAVALQNVVMPAGTLKIGESEYDVRTNGTPRTVDQIGNLPIRQVPGTTIYLRDLASVSDSFQVHTNIVRQDGRRGVLITVLKRNASTLDVVK